MSTNDVPGFKSSNNDVLAMGCWAESSDGSLIFVESVENGRVVYSMFDAAFTPILEYRDAMPEKDFKVAFSWKADRKPIKDKKASAVPSDIKWTWHDKTPFPWDRVIKQGAKDGLRFASASDMLAQADKVAASVASNRQDPADPPTDAQRVADSLNLRGQKFSAADRSHLTDRTLKRVAGLARRLADKLDGLGKGA